MFIFRAGDGQWQEGPKRALKKIKKTNDRSVISVLWISLIVKVEVWSQRAVQAARCQPACLNFSPSEPRNTLIILCNMWPFDSGKQKQRESCYATRKAAAEPRSPRTGNFDKHKLSWKIRMGRILWLLPIFVFVIIFLLNLFSWCWWRVIKMLPQVQAGSLFWEP